MTIPDHTYPRYMIYDDICFMFYNMLMIWYDMIWCMIYDIWWYKLHDDDIYCWTCLIFMLSYDLWLQAQTPGVTHFRAYHRPLEGNLCQGKTDQNHSQTIHVFPHHCFHTNFGTYKWPNPISNFLASHHHPTHPNSRTKIHVFMYFCIFRLYFQLYFCIFRLYFQLYFCIFRLYFLYISFININTNYKYKLKYKYKL